MKKVSAPFFALFVLSTAACRYDQAVGSTPTTTETAAQSAAARKQSAADNSSATTSGTTSGTAPTATALTRGEFMDGIVALVCGNVSAACTTEGYTFAERKCEASIRADGTLGDPGANATFDPSLAATCLATSPSAVAAGTLDPSCSHVFTGTQPVNAACTSNNECALPVGALSVTCANALCLAGYQVGLGAECESYAQLKLGRYSSCDPTTYCDNDNVCHATVADGSSCFGVAGAYACDQFESFCSTVDSTCHPRVALGGACTGSAECRWEDDLYCAFATNVCTPRDKIGDVCHTPTDSGTSSCSGDTSHAPQAAVATCSTLTSRCIARNALIDGATCTGTAD